MTMMANVIKGLVVFVLCFFLIASTASAETILDVTDGKLGAPESLSAYSDGMLYVSYQNGPKPGGIAKMTPNGEIVDSQWVYNLNNPKGTLIVGDDLYVTDVTKLLKYHIPTKQLVGSYPGGVFLNDVAADEQGNIYVTDMGDNAVYLLKDGKLEQWLKHGDLENPNGILIKGQDMYLASWGWFEDVSKRAKAKPGAFTRVDLSTKKIERLTPKIGQLDGIVFLDRDRILLSDWTGSKLYVYDDSLKKISRTYEMNMFIPGGNGKGPGDIIINRDTLYVPLAKDGRILMINTSLFGNN